MLSKKITSSVVALSLVVASQFAVSQAAFAKDGDKEATMLSNNIKSTNNNMDFLVEPLEPVAEAPGFYVFKVTIKNNTNVYPQYIVSNGDVVLQSAISFSKRSELSSSYISKYLFANFSTEGLTLIAGNPKSKNAIVLIEDLQCPFCRKANEYINGKLKGKKDYAIYLMHFPLVQIHPKAMLFARILESGMKAGDNFDIELMSGAYDQMSDDDTIKAFAGKSKDKKTFLAYMKDDQAKVNEVVGKIQSQAKLAGERYLVTGTPVIVFNGTAMRGFNVQDPSDLDKAILDKIKN